LEEQLEDPVYVGTLAGSASFSMLAKRNASGHDVKASTREGDKVVGTSNMGPS
jgi:hypothetical protein